MLRLYAAKSKRFASRETVFPRESLSMFSLLTAHPTPRGFAPLRCTRARQKNKKGAGPCLSDNPLPRRDRGTGMNAHG